MRDIPHSREDEGRTARLSGRSFLREVQLLAWALSSERPPSLLRN